MFNVEEIRRQFPALHEEFGGRPAIFFDNPGGTQVHESVIAAMVDFMTRRNSNTHGLFETSVRTDAVIDEAHQAVADLLGCDEDEVVFGNNMTSLTFHVSRSLARELGPEDEVMVTRLDHDANVMPWVLAAQDRGARVRWADVDVESARSIWRMCGGRLRRARNCSGRIRQQCDRHDQRRRHDHWLGRRGGRHHVCGRGPVCATRVDRC